MGILHSLTGTMAWTEGPVVDATLLAIEEINGRGGVLGREVLPVVVDGQSEETVFARHAEKLIATEDVCTLFGCWTSASRKSVLPILKRETTYWSIRLSMKGWSSVPIFFTRVRRPINSVRSSVGIRFSAKETLLFWWGGICIFAGHKRDYRDEVEGLGGQIVGEEYVPPDSTEVTRVVRTIAKCKPDVIFNSLVGYMDLFYTRLLRAAGITPAKVPTVYFSIGEIELLSLSTKETLGDYAAWNYFQSIDRPENRIFVEKFRLRYGRQRVTADPMEAAYLGVHLWAQAVEEAGTTNTSAIRQALRKQKFDAPGGPVRIDSENQHTWKTVRLGKIVEGGQFEIVWSSERPIRPEPYPSSRPAAAWNAFLTGLHKEWDGRWTKSQD